MSVAGARADAALPLLAARSVALYAFSLLAVAGALLAWAPGEAGLLAFAAAGLAAALVIGEAAGGIFDAGVERTGRLRLRVTTGAAYGGLVVLALTAAVGSGDPRVLRNVAVLFTLLQAALLLLVDLGRTHVAPVANALLLVVVAALHGGTIAAVSVTGALALLGAFLALDHAARVLQAYPRSRGALLGPTLGRAAATLAPVVLGLSLVFVLFPAPPYSRVRFTIANRAQDEEVAAAYRRLVALALVGSALVFGVVRLLRRDRGKAAPLEETLAVERGVEEPLPETTPSVRREYRGRRGRIVRAYVDVLGRARSSGFRARPSQTPLDLAALLPVPAGPLATLTGLFVGARYGPDEPSEEQAVAAEHAAREVAAALRRGDGAHGRAAPAPRL
jgi:hypothetical protein